MAGLSLATNRFRDLASGGKKKLISPLSLSLSPFSFPASSSDFFLKIIFNKGFETSDAAKLWDNGRWKVDADWLERGVGHGRWKVDADWLEKGVAQKQD